MTKTFFVPLLVLLLHSPAVSQPRRDTANCHGLLTATLASGRSRGDLSRCGEALIPGIMRALQDAGAHDPLDHRWFATVYRYGSRIRDERILRQSLDLAADRSASAPARATGLMTAVGQVGAGYFPAEAGTFEDLLRQGVPPLCRWSHTTDGQVWAQHPLPSGSVTQVRRVVARIATDRDAAEMNRLARCVQLLIRTLDPNSAPTAAEIRVVSVCDRRFTVSNDGDADVDLTWAVDDTAEWQEIVVSANSTRNVSTAERGTLVVSRGGERIAAVPNSERGCPTQE